MTLKKMIDGIEIECAPEEEAEIRAKWAEYDREQIAIEYSVKRKSEYPSIPDQLDMLWHAMNSAEIPMAIKFYSVIAEIKAKYPKPL